MNQHRSLNYPPRTSALPPSTPLQQQKNEKIFKGSKGIEGCSPKIKSSSVGLKGLRPQEASSTPKREGERQEREIYQKRMSAAIPSTAGGISGDSGTKGVLVLSGDSGLQLCVNILIASSFYKIQQPHQ